MPSSIPAGFRALPLSINQLTLSVVLKCGQSFRWVAFPLVPLDSPATDPEDVPTHEYRFCLKDRVICLQQSPNTLFYRSVLAAHADVNEAGSTSPSSLSERRDAETLVFIRDYFQLDTDLLKLYEEWSDNDTVFRNLKGRFSGIRMLRQDPWECLVSFICSSNNNISRISKMVQNLCTHFSLPIVTLDDPAVPGASTSSSPYHAFPPPSALASPAVSSKLRTLGFGYRANFIQKTAAMLLEAHGSDEAVFEFLSSLRSIDTDSARAELLKLMGVGRKVADCVLLMSLDKREVVPVDTHVLQIATKHYGMRGSSTGKTPMTPKLYDDVNARLTSIWGRYAGWAHLILFTADLKAFATHGYSTPPPSMSPSKSSRTSRAATPATSPTKKRKRPQIVRNGVELKLEEIETESVIKMEEILLDGGGLAERVKRRRRATVSSNLKVETSVEC
ncbi:hypothetical protein M0805_002746 [Coniferiporia weirii]|nr:hypothetical protein M0805_002746 [Coniferiporia weirii]